MNKKEGKIIMKSIMRRVISFLLMVALFAWSIPALFSAEPLVRADYSISPDYAARYPNGVIEFYETDTYGGDGRKSFR